MSMVLALKCPPCAGWGRRTTRQGGYATLHPPHEIMYRATPIDAAGSSSIAQ